MTKRLQVLMDESDFDEIRRIARRERTTVAEWVRAKLRLARSADSGSDARAKLEAVRSATAHSFPIADMDRLLEEIEAGYLGREAR